MKSVIEIMFRGHGQVRSFASALLQFVAERCCGLHAEHFAGDRQHLLRSDCRALPWILCESNRCFCLGVLLQVALDVSPSTSFRSLRLSIITLLSDPSVVVLSETAH